MPHRTRLLLALAVTVLGAAPARPQALPPREAAKRLHVADGLEVRLFAAEPLVRQPVSIGFDDRGRMWVVQYIQYPIPNGLKAVSADQYLRTKYDRVPEPPPCGPRGNDRITILEDTDGDGYPDRAKDFIRGLNLASGLALGHGGAFVLQTPYLLFYPDRNRDDVPDADPEVLLRGFGMEDAHAVANSLTWGPDGWLYGAQGSTVTAKIRGVEFQQGIWRYHPRTHRFELFAEGGGNEWGVEFDRFGNLLGSGNEVEPVIHYVQGAYYVKGFGKHGPLHNPYTFGYFNPVQHIGYLGDSLSGGTVIYQADALPPPFRNAGISPHTRHSAVRWETVQRKGSTFTTTFAGDFLTSSNIQFRPVDQTVGPDGAVYVADWCDKNISHSDPLNRARWYNPQRDDGRVWRVTARGAAGPVGHFDLARRTSDQLVDLLSHPNDWYRREARRLLAERRDPAVRPRLRRLLFESTDETLPLQALWALYVGGGFDAELAARTLAHPHEYVRSWTVRLLGDDCTIPAALRPRLVGLARTDSSPVVRRQLACTAKRLPADQGLPIVAELLRRSEDVTDTFIPLLLWWAVEDKAVAAREQVLRMFTTPEVWKLPLARDVVLERLARRYAAEGTDAGYQSCARLFAAAPTDSDALVLVRGLDQQFAGMRFPRTPAALAEPLARLWRAKPGEPALTRVLVRMADASAYRHALARASDRTAPPAERVAFIELLGEWGRGDALPVLLKVLRGREPDAVRDAVCSALPHYADPAIPATLLDLYPTLRPALRARAVDLLCGRKPWALALLHAVDRGAVPPRDVPLDRLRQLLEQKDKALTALVTKHWGKLQPATPREKQGRITAVSQMLARGPGDVGRGKVLFTKHCATCHTLHGEGNKVGPDLTTADRKNLDSLLVNVIDPSAIIRQEFLAYTAATKDGRLLTGLIAEQTPTTVTLLDANNRRTVLPRGQIEELAPSPQSLMPEGILDPLSEQEIRDLFAYLRTDVLPPGAQASE